MDSKPLITCAGDDKLFVSLKKSLVENLPKESVEWKRSHMRNPKLVYVTGNFIPFCEERLPHEGTKNLLGQAFFHIYWSSCHDVDHYKQTVKENINNWILKLKARKIYDWLIVVVDQSENRKSNKTKLLPRTTVLDKVKSDFPSQGSQRCISLLDPNRNDSRSAESWQQLLQRIRYLILQAYSRQLSLFEEHMRTQRERRNEHGWNFQNFFFLQEELAFVLEMLGLYDEALVQYDELDALFTQFVINSNVGEMPEWLTNYSNPADLWCGVCLIREKYMQLRETLLNGNPCLLDLRNYLFSRQCALLLLLCRPWEVAQRTLPFLHNCISELKTLEILMPPGSVACWVFLSCFEILQTCEKFSDISQMKEYSLYCAGLWAYAREKLHYLGILCGLMPDLDENSEKLHIVVSLLAGMGEDPYPVGADSPHAKLRAALSSKESFLKHYLELSELTMGTFKHNRRIRTARLIGRDLAQLYMKMKQPQKAISFLADLLKTYREENWEMLTTNIQQDLLQCYKDMGDIGRYLKTCIRLSASVCLSFDQRKDYFQEIITSSEKLESEPLRLRTEKTFLVSGAKIDSSIVPITKNSEIAITFHIQSNLPNEIICRNIKLVLKKQNAPSVEKSKQSDSQYLSSKTPVPTAHSPMSPILSGELGIPSRDDMPQRILVQPQLVVSSYRQDGAQVYSVMCRNIQQVLRRRDSQGFHKDDINEEESGLFYKSSMVKLLPGHNVVTIPVKAAEIGMYVFHRLWMEWGNIHFALSNLSPLFSFVVSEEQPSIIRKHVEENGDLVAGLEQILILLITSGNSSIPKESMMHIKSSRGLQLKYEGNDKLGDWSDDISIPLVDMDPYQSTEVQLKAIAPFGPQRNANMIEHFVSLHCPWMGSSQRISLHFLPPFFVVHKLHTCDIRKYIQVVVHGTTQNNRFILSNSQLEVLDQKNVPLKQLCLQEKVIVRAEVTASFLWEIMGEDADIQPTHFNFSMDYVLQDQENTQTNPFNFEIKLNNYETLYGVRARVEPPKGTEFCRVGIMCFMHVSICKINNSDYTSLMYEVVADQTMWAVCGRTAGVVNIDESGKHAVVLDVMPLISGFLPLPNVRLSKYIPAEQKQPMTKESTPTKSHPSKSTPSKEHKSTPSKEHKSTPSKEHKSTPLKEHKAARLEPFDTGQVYSWSRAMQVHVLPNSNSLSLDVSS